MFNVRYLRIRKNTQTQIHLDTLFMLKIHCILFSASATQWQLEKESENK